jgi:hypothetical protein
MQNGYEKPKGDQEHDRIGFEIKKDFRNRPLLSRLTCYRLHVSDITLLHSVFKIKPNA